MNPLNKLNSEKSPYLLQHKDNPVNWYPWGEQAFAAAAAEDKPIFLSIGYSTCYWCHVMEQDSFENADLAHILNESFISIKVDREERPDIDQVYMDAVIAFTGHGGWPMSVFLTPDRKPFFGGTFFPQAQFRLLLERITGLWNTDRTTIVTSTAQVMELMNRQATATSAPPLDEQTLCSAYSYLRENFDPQYAGFGAAPKFPQPLSLSLLLRLYQRSGQVTARGMVVRTLEAMARGGVYDQLGGGFHRYSTDAAWIVPHFEKMLYDNALLSWTYFEAYQATKEPLLARVGRETLEFVLREMTSECGGFFSAQDAGEVGAEGEYYVWAASELEHLLSPEEFKLFSAAYGVTAGGNFENGSNVLHLTYRHPWSIKDDPLLRSAQQKLLRLRSTRSRPRCDDKVLTSWNALMISALAKGWQVLQERRFLDAAQRGVRFLMETMFDGQQLLHRYRDGAAEIPGFADDYANLIQALLDLYDCDFDISWVRLAQELQTLLDRDFWDTSQKGYFYGESDASLIIRKKDFSDNATPSANGTAAHNLLRLFHLTGNAGYQTRAIDTLQALSPYVNRFPAAYCSALMALDFLLDSPKEVVIAADAASPEFSRAVSLIYSEFFPNKVLAAANSDASVIPLVAGKAATDGILFYVCEQQSCSQPTADVQELLARLRQHKPLNLQ